MPSDVEASFHLAGIPSELPLKAGVGGGVSLRAYVRQRLFIRPFVCANQISDDRGARPRLPFNTMNQHSASPLHSGGDECDCFVDWKLLVLLISHTHARVHIPFTKVEFGREGTGHIEDVSDTLATEGGKIYRIGFRPKVDAAVLIHTHWVVCVVENRGKKKALDGSSIAFTAEVEEAAEEGMIEEREGVERDEKGVAGGLEVAGHIKGGVRAVVSVGG